MLALVAASFRFCQWALQRLLARHGARWRLDPARGAADIASLPLLAALLSVALFVAMLALNNYTRVAETEADLWGLHLAREPHGEAEVLLKLTDYRKPDPTALDEWLFYTHPSTRTRIYNAMRGREAMAGQASTAGASPR